MSGHIKKNKYKIMDDYAIIYLNRKNGDIFEAYIDIEDVDKVINKWDYAWCITQSVKKDYYYVLSNIYRNIRDKISPTKIYLHDYVLDLPEGVDVDHINHNGLDNRKSNLRCTPHDKNNKNRKSKNTNNKSGYRNVFWSTKDEKWLVTLQVDGKSKCFGRFKYEDLDKAGILAEQKRQEIYEEFAGKN